jgi:hypothetical protein
VSLTAANWPRTPPFSASFPLKRSCSNSFFVLINAIQEQQKTIEEMKIIIEQLQLKINELITDK